MTPTFPGLEDGKKISQVLEDLDVKAEMELQMSEVETPYQKLVDRFWVEKEGKIEAHIYRGAQNYFNRAGNLEGFSVHCKEFFASAQSIENEVQDFGAHQVLEAVITPYEKQALIETCHVRCAEEIPVIVEEARVAF